MLVYPEGSPSLDDLGIASFRSVNRVAPSKAPDAATPMATEPGSVVPAANRNRFEW